MKKNYSYLVFCLSVLVGQIISAQSLNATLLELGFSNDGFPERFTEVDNGFFFSVDDDQLWFSNGTVQNTYLVKDFNSGTYDDISSLTAVGSKVFFVAELGDGNRELWVSDGTEGGTIQLTTRNVTHSNEDINEIIAFNGKVYFDAYSEGYGVELWVSDGTPSGTFVLKDIAENTMSSNPKEFYVFNNKLFFKAFTTTYSIELWTTDGTEAGTVLFKDIKVGSDTGVGFTQGYITFNGHFYFYADNGTTGRELWKSDGTEAGTQLLKDIRPGSFSSYSIMRGAVLNDKLIFVSNDGTSGNELWITDGTSGGTMLIKNLNPGSGSGYVSNGIIKNVGSKVFFNGTNGVGQSGLWATDGTDVGTIFLNAAVPQLLSTNSTNTHAVYFANNTENKSVFWKSDGTVLGTTVISETIGGITVSVVDQNYLIYDNKIFFNGYNTIYGNELWVTDGTPEGTALFMDFNHSNGISPSLLKVVDNKLFFRGSKNGYFGLFTSDGTAEGTSYVDINSGVASVSTSSIFTDFNGKLALSAFKSGYGYELWMSDGTEVGTYLVKDILPGSGNGMYDFPNLYPIGNKLYFSANNGIDGFEPWISDGTEVGTFMIKDLRPGGSNLNSYPKGFVSLNGTIYFYTQQEDALWKTDGTEAGTTKVIDLNDIRGLNVVNNKLLIIAETSGTTYGPHDLWVSDGTTAGTQHIKSFGDGIDSDIQYMTILNDELYFVANIIENGKKAIYKTNGTLEGTLMVFDGNSHPLDIIDINVILTCGNYVYFGVAPLFGFEKELWRTDGTVSGTLKVAGSDTPDFSFFRSLTCFDGLLLYLAESSSQTIWVSNGQPNEAVQFDVQITNGPNFQGYDNISKMATNGIKLFFEGTNTKSGSEIYVTTPDFSTLSIDQKHIISNSVKTQVNIYPNPAKETITIRSKHNDPIRSLELFDLSGNRLLTQENTALSNEMIYKITQLTQGLYVMKVNFLNGTSESVKLLKIN